LRTGRGQQGNALKCVLAMPFVLDGTEGCVIVEAHGQRHEVTFRVNHVRQQPEVRRTTSANPIIRNGTRMTVRWPQSASSMLAHAKPRFLQIAKPYVWMNPHLSLVVSWQDDPEFAVAAADLAWPKWRPSDPTSVHWYTQERLERLIAAYVSHDETRGKDRTVREFIAEFRGFSGSTKRAQVLKATETARALLRSLCPDGRFDSRAIAALLNAMQAYSQPVKPAALGAIGKKHLTHRCAAAGGDPESFEYRKVQGVTDRLPWVVETAFAWAPEIDSRHIVIAINWSPAIGNPFREMGRIGESLDTILARQRATQEEQVIFFLHVALPRVAFTDRGKSAVVLPSSVAAESVEAAPAFARTRHFPQGENPHHTRHFPQGENG
jgi:DNA topoisomerase VI subunit B